jgi:DNA polymerase III subunit delta
MASAGEKALHAALKKRVFDPVYYLFGEDDFLKDSRSRELIDAAVDPSTRDFNLEVRRASELDPEGLDALLGTPPMLAERRVVVLRDIDKLKKGARTVLDRYLARPAPDTVLVLIAPNGAKPDKGLSEHATAVEFSPLTGDRLPRWVSHHAETVLERAITPEAVTLLVEAVGSDLAQLAVELEKLASYAHETIDERAVAEIVGVRRGESAGALLDAVAAKDTNAALQLIPIVLQLPKTTAVSIVMALTTQMLALAWARAARDRGFPAVGIERELFNLLKESSAYPGRAWGEAVSAWSRALGGWKASELEAAIDALLAADHALKESRLSSDEQVIASLVLTLCGAPRRAAA